MKARMSAAERRLDVTRDAIAQATGRLLERETPATLTMSAIAEEAALGRATLYRHAADVDAAIALWRTRQIGQHLQHVRAIASSGDDEGRLARAVEVYAVSRQHAHGHRHGSAELELAAGARAEVTRLLEDLLRADAAAGRLRSDVPVDELAVFVAAAVDAAPSLKTPAAARRLAALIVGTVRG